MAPFTSRTVGMALVTSLMIAGSYAAAVAAELPAYAAKSSERQAISHAAQKAAEATDSVAAGDLVQVEYSA